MNVKSSTYINFNKGNSKKDPKFEVGDHVRISKYKKIFAKCYVPNWSEEVFVIKKIKRTVAWTCIISDLNGEEIIGTFYKKELQKADQKEFRVEKSYQEKLYIYCYKLTTTGDKLYVKWKGYNNSWIKIVFNRF